MEKQVKVPSVLSDRKTREAVMKEIAGNRKTYKLFMAMNQEFQEKFIEFCMGVRGVKMTYDPFFKHIFNAEIHPERLSSLLSEIIGRSLKVKRALENEHSRITAEASLIILDLLVEFESGELADVEIQKIGYMFPGERASCYASDMMMRQYEREKSRRGEAFNYRNLNKVYTIVIMEKSSKEFKKFPKSYVHRGKWRFDTGLELDLLQEFYFIPLDIFLGLEDNRTKEDIGSELEAWLYFIGSDQPEHIYKVIKSYPWFEELYRDIEYFRYHPEEAVQMFSDALRIMDENTVKYMIEEQKRELEEQKRELEGLKRENEEQRRKSNLELEEQRRESNLKIEKKDREIEELKKALEKALASKEDTDKIKSK